MGDNRVFVVLQPENTNLEEDVELWLPVEIHVIPHSGFIEKVENVSTNHRPGWPYSFSDRPVKYKLGIERNVFASCLVSLNRVQMFQRQSEMSQAISGRAAILIFRSVRKHVLGRGRWYLVFCQVSLNYVQIWQRISRNVYQAQTGTAILFFPIGLKTQNWSWTLRSCFLWSIIGFRSADSENKSIMSQSMRGWDGYFVFLIVPKNKYVVEKVKFLFPVKFQ